MLSFLINHLELVSRCFSSPLNVSRRVQSFAFCVLRFAFCVLLELSSCYTNVAAEIRILISSDVNNL